MRKADATRFFADDAIKGLKKKLVAATSSGNQTGLWPQMSDWCTEKGCTLGAGSIQKFFDGTQGITETQFRCIQSFASNYAIVINEPNPSAGKKPAEFNKAPALCNVDLIRTDNGDGLMRNRLDFSTASADTPLTLYLTVYRGIHRQRIKKSDGKWLDIPLEMKSAILAFGLDRDVKFQPNTQLTGAQHMGQSRENGKSYHSFVLEFADEVAKRHKFEEVEIGKFDNPVSATDRVELRLQAGDIGLAAGHKTSGSEIAGDMEYTDYQIEALNQLLAAAQARESDDYRVFVCKLLDPSLGEED